ncbi:MAG: DUF1365 domain-containing protein [Methylomicrobium sp.]|nr:DUF1365 domain-containing protein [Methylomicrobium sp.]
MNSRLVTGWVRHRRYVPKPHAFRYPVFMTWLDLDEVEQVMSISRLWSKERFNLVSYYRSDYLGDPQMTIADAIKSRIQQQTGVSFEGRIILLTHLRYLGHSFNPVSFYFCYPEGDKQPRFILAEITNTPWDERFSYLLDTRDSPEHANKWSFRFDKSFHVSPFMPMDQQYHWRFSLQDKKLAIHMEVEQDSVSCFDATLLLNTIPLTAQTMRNIPLHYPFMTLKVVAAIYWQAMRLWLKGIPFYSHPEKIIE